MSEAIALKTWRRVTNHIGTVQAIATANLCEQVVHADIAMYVSPKKRKQEKGISI